MIIFFLSNIYFGCIKETSHQKCYHDVSFCVNAKCKSHYHILTSLPHYNEAGRIKNSSLPSAQQYAITFRRWPIVVSFNVLSWTLSKTNYFTKHAHNLKHLNFYAVFNLCGQYQGRFWLVCSNAQCAGRQ